MELTLAFLVCQKRQGWVRVGGPKTAVKATMKAAEKNSKSSNSSSTNSNNTPKKSENNSKPQKRQQPEGIGDGKWNVATRQLFCHQKQEVGICSHCPRQECHPHSRQKVWQWPRLAERTSDATSGQSPRQVSGSGHEVQAVPAVDPGVHPESDSSLVRSWSLPMLVALLDNSHLEQTLGAHCPSVQICRGVWRLRFRCHRTTFRTLSALS